ncbi:MAG: calcium-binding protein [Solirubrobacteraceae bacterium]
MHRTRRLAVLAALVVSAAIAAPAQATVTCSFNAGAKSLTITADAGGEGVRILRQAGPGTNLVIQTIAQVPVVCSGSQATVTNTDSINYADTSASSTYLVVDERNGAIGPGATSEGALNVSEIEISADLGSTGNDTVWVYGLPTADGIRVGSPAADTVGLNVGTHESAADGDDIKATGADVVYVTPGAGDDYVSGQGGLGSGNPLGSGVTFAVDGGDGDDHLTGGGGDDQMVGSAGDDVIDGRVGDDIMAGGTGDDVVDGGIGKDTISYFISLTAVHVDLALTVAQDSGEGMDTLTGLEGLTGSQLDDVLIGDGDANALHGREGNDRIEGRGGDDELDGGPGVDTADYGAATGSVTVDLAASASGAAGSDALKGFENLLGSAFADVLSGDAGANRIDGGAGADVIAGLGGDDDLRVRDGENDTADCGAGTDAVIADAAATDTLIGCENADVLPAAAAGSGDAPGGPPAVTPGGSPGQTDAPAGDHQGPRVAGLRIVKGRLRLLVDEAAVLTIRLQRRTAHGYRAVRRRSVTATVAGPLRVSLGRLAGGRYRVVVSGVDTAGNRSVPATRRFGR